MKADLKKVQSTAEARGFFVGTKVSLRAFRNTRGDKRMKFSQIVLVGKEAMIIDLMLDKDGNNRKDKAGCNLVKVEVEGYPPEEWRVSNLRKIKT